MDQEFRDSADTYSMRANPTRTRALTRRRLMWFAAALIAGVVATLAPTMAASTSATTVVTAEVLSATNLNVATGCATAVADVTDFGQLMPGTDNATGNDCTVTFGSSNDTSMVKAYSVDQSGMVMTKIPDRRDMAFNGGLGYSEVTGCAANSKGWTDVAVHTDGKIVAVGDCGADWGVARYNADGTLDTAGFNSPNGYATVDVGGAGDAAFGVAIEPDGDVVVVGYAGVFAPTTTHDFVVARFTSAGVLDTAGFNSPTGFYTFDQAAGHDDALAVAIQPDGKIVAVGTSNGGGGNDHIALRLNTNGTLDTAGFNNPTGWITVPVGIGADEANAVALQPDGSIIMAGTGQNPLYRASLVRISSAGVLDTAGFGAPNGWILTDIPGSSADEAHDVTVLADGSIVSAGRAFGLANVGFALKADSAGVLDASFGAPNGYTVFTGTPAYTSVRFESILQDPAGGFMAIGGTTGPNSMVAVRLDAAGELDTSYGGGTGYADFIPDDNEIHAAAWQGSSIVVVGDGTGPGFNTGSAMRLGGDEVNDYVDTSTDWDAGTNMFGACLRSVAGGGVNGTWTVDAGNDCVPDDGNDWSKIATLPSDPEAKVAESTNAGETAAQINMRWGFRTATDQSPGLYSAPVVFEAIAPNV